MLPGLEVIDRPRCAYYRGFRPIVNEVGIGWSLIEIQCDDVRSFMPKALALVRDLFFRSKLDAVADSAGAEIVYASDLEAAARRAREASPAVVLADLSDSSFPVAETAHIVRAAAPNARLIGFASHLDLKPLNAAREAGFDLTLSRSEFTARIAEFLK